MADENNPAEENPEDIMDDWAAALAEQEVADSSGATSGGSDAQPANIFQSFDANAVPAGAPNNIDMILDIPVALTVELGRTKIAIRNLLQLAQGSVVELDGLAGEPMDVLVNGCLIAQGEVVVVNEKFGIRLTDIITPAERIRRLHK
ncbi:MULTISPECIES: flagellar motor switch protein FliN [Chitinibacter]|uniref:flagellar motor switch protein FliN n=1 Tax=Chitinibacter TaxID=230666 RepID=UPI00041C503B|nr:MULTISPECIES: flagellar motor switch protein FliN [Chitinibacter]